MTRSSSVFAASLSCGTELGWLSPLADEESIALTLARFKRMQLLRIAARDVLDFAMLPEVALELSNLADTVLQGALEYMVRKMTARFGRPLSPADHGPIESEIVVLALGKHGGRELNYSSDIDLMFLFTDEGETSGADCHHQQRVLYPGVRMV